MLLLRNEWMSYTRSTDAKIGLLREIIEKVKRGEKVDVEKILGTGDMGKEREWEEGMFFFPLLARGIIGGRLLTGY